MLKSIELVGFKSFGKKSELVFDSRITAIVGPNGSGKSNVAEGFRFVLGEQSMKSMRSKKGEDLIWGGSGALARANRAGVKVVFDNADRLLDIDFSEVAIERVVYRDGQNEYLINGSRVRLKDVVRLLAGANIAGTGYQIISQGEADRILNATPRDRREMVEDALGLKLYQHKKAESERKLAETQQNSEKVESLRRELAPHLKFLRKQVEKIEQAREMREELTVKLADYLAREQAWLTAEGVRLGDEKRAIDEEVQAIDRGMQEARAAVPRGEEHAGESAHTQELTRLEGELQHARREHEELVRELGRAEAKLEIVGESAGSSVGNEEAGRFADEMSDALTQLEQAADMETVRSELAAVRSKVARFLEKVRGRERQEDPSVRAEVERLNRALESAASTARDMEARISELRAREKQEAQEQHEAERALLQLEAKKRDFLTQRRTIIQAEESLAQTKQSFDEEMREGVALLGQGAAKLWEGEDIPEGALSEPRAQQEKRRREIERLKIKIEESGASNADEVIREFNQTKERDEFLTREMHDLQQSAEKLHQIIDELDAKIDTRFSEGLGKINETLQQFFEKLFGGGTAKLVLEKPRKVAEEEGLAETPADSDPIRGLDIHVQLPRKKVSGLEVLSGGERALTSIALIFAMSQVNPPPFLILDETDAALDEANSKRYADMVRELGKRSQLILVTHNRATMSAAGALYGVTMGADGVSKLLSVKLEEAERVAK